MGHVRLPVPMIYHPVIYEFEIISILAKAQTLPPVSCLENICSKSCPAITLQKVGRGVGWERGGQRLLHFAFMATVDERS